MGQMANGIFAPAETESAPLNMFQVLIFLADKQDDVPLPSRFILPRGLRQLLR